VPVFVVAAMLAVMAASSTSWVTDPVEIDNGGGRTTSTNYDLRASIGGNVFAGTASGLSYANESDYLPMLESSGSAGPPGLFLNPGTHNPGDSNEAPGTLFLPMVQLQLLAGQASDVTVINLTIRAQGTGPDDVDVTALYLYLDGDGDGQIDAASSPIATVNSPYTLDNGYVNVALSETIPAGASRTWLIAYDFSGSASGTFVAAVSPGDINASDSLMLPVGVTGTAALGGIKTLGLGVPGTLSFSMGPANQAEGDHFPPGGNGAIFQFQVSASSVEDVRITGFTLRATGTADDASDVEEVKIFLDTDQDGLEPWTSTPLAGTLDPFSGDNGQARFSFPAQTVSASDTLTFLVSARFSPQTQGGQTFGLSIRYPAHVTASGVTSSATPTMSGLPVGSLVSIDLAEPPPPPPTVEDDGGCAGTGGPGSPLALVLLALAGLSVMRLRATGARA